MWQPNSNQRPYYIVYTPWNWIATIVNNYVCTIRSEWRVDTPKLLPSLFFLESIQRLIECFQRVMLGKKRSWKEVTLLHNIWYSRTCIRAAPFIVSHYSYQTIVSHSLLMAYNSTPSPSLFFSLFLHSWYALDFFSSTTNTHTQVDLNQPKRPVYGVTLMLLWNNLISTGLYRVYTYSIWKSVYTWIWGLQMMLIFVKQQLLLCVSIESCINWKNLEPSKTIGFRRDSNDRWSMLFETYQLSFDWFFRVTLLLQCVYVCI